MEKIALESVKNDISEAITNVEDASKPSEIKGIKKLSGYKYAFRIKIGHYRIGLFIEKDIVEFARVVHRKDINKIFP